MCAVSMIYDHYHDKWDQWRRQMPNTLPTVPYIPSQPLVPQIPAADISEFYKLLERAREYDKKNNQPDCELESKKEKLRKLAEDLGVKIEFT